MVNELILLVFGVIYFAGYQMVIKNSNILEIQWVCYFQGYIIAFFPAMEVYILMCIALERYFAIKRQRPLSRHRIIGLLVFGYCLLGGISR